MTIQYLWEQTSFTPNAEQERAIIHIGNPLYLTAGPGSGKTRVLLWRTLNLIVFHNILPEHIFLATFTEKAALQLKEGLKNYLGQVTNINDQPYDISKMFVGTIHSLCQRILKDRKLNPNRPSKLIKVMDDLESYFFYSNRRNWQALMEAGGLSELSLEEQNHRINEYFSGKQAKSSRHDAINNLASLFNRLTDEVANPVELLAQTQESFLQGLLKMYICYLNLLNSNDDFERCDFSLLQQKALNVLDNPKARNYFKHVIIDEYQDTNTIQERLVFALAEGSKNLCVVGDDDQALYRFRGATVENFVEFPRRCEDYFGIAPITIPLNTNYRSRKQIVDFYTSFVQEYNWQKPQNPTEYYRVHDKYIRSNSQDDNVSVIVSSKVSPVQVSEEIANLVRRLIDEGKVSDPNQIAFLFPALKENEQVKRMKKALEDVGLRVYAPRAGRFLEVEESQLIFGIFLYIFGKPEQGPYTSKDYLGFFGWMDDCLNQIEDEFKKDKALKSYLDTKKSEVNQVLSDFQILKSIIEKNGWQLDQEFDLERMKPALMAAKGLSEFAKKTLNGRLLTIQVRRRLEGKDGEKPPFKLIQIITRVTSLDWTILDLFYRFSGFQMFKKMYDLAEQGIDEGPICNLGLISQYLSKFSELYSPVMNAGFLADDMFQRVFFMSFTYAIYRRGESEFENTEDPFPKGRIPFLTIHQAKGLEFPVVVMPNLRKGKRESVLESTIRTLLPKDGEPLDRISDYDTARMFYVGLSRGQQLTVLGNYGGQGNYINKEFRTLVDNLTLISNYDSVALNPQSQLGERSPKAYSYTADYLLYEKCPRQYMIFRRYGFVPSRSQTQFFGSLVHRTLEDLHLKLIHEAQNKQIKP